MPAKQEQAQRENVEVTDHAALRYQQRAQEAAQYPKERLRELWEDAAPADLANVQGVARRVGELVLVARERQRPRITTVLLERGESA